MFHVKHRRLRVAVTGLNLRYAALPSCRQLTSPTDCAYVSRGTLLPSTVRLRRRWGSVPHRPDRQSASDTLRASANKHVAGSASLGSIFTNLPAAVQCST